ncbi:hypothetical protein SO802_006641 [Lithocarpus litseifolius]|uniref:Telomerase reverse transcriptase n=1 Tax=Lithocarpus litseifolius TaxID=425828 RepID=A0AAW2DPL8_9ROSI
MAFLDVVIGERREGPPQYRKLLNQCFLVLSENAPPLSHFNPHSRWSRSQIVQRTIEMLISEQPMSSNIKHSTPIMELLCSPAWYLLLQRVGDDVMLYLLKYTSIFVPVPCKKHYQVSGPPISDLCVKFSNQTLEPQDQPTSLDKCGSNKKRALVDGANSMLEIQKFSRDCLGSNVRRCSRSFSRLYGNKRSQMSLLEEVTPIIGTGTNNTEGDSNEELQKISNQIAAKSRKRSRPFSWLRHRKRRHLNFEETSIKTSSATILTEKDSVSGRLQDDVNSCLSSCEKIPCFSVSQAPKPLVVAKGAYINRKSMFYDMERSSSMFPGKHILNSLKSNIAGAKFLIGNIFGLSEINATQEMPCCQSSGFCVNKSACMYHSLVKLFERVVCRTQCCQHLRLLDKHCAVPELNDTGKSSTSFKLSIWTILLCISCGESKKNVPEKSHGFNTAYCKEIEPQFEANTCYCLRSQVVSFVWAVIRSIVPTELLGTPSNWRMLRRNIARFIQLRRFEKFPLKKCMHKLKVSEFSFLSTQNFSCCFSNQ